MLIGVCTVVGGCPPPIPAAAPNEVTTSTTQAREPLSSCRSRRRSIVGPSGGAARQVAAGGCKEASGERARRGEEVVPSSNLGKKSKKKGKSDEPWPGVVLKIRVSNFMCHRLFSIQLLRRGVTFINGRNGSGKSAVLAALQICLGAKAHLTHRAKKMTDFIRHGWPGDAVLEVTLLNNEHGFKFDVYGDAITVRRTIKPSGGGGFELLGKDEKVKSKDKMELFRMLDELSIQVDNPIAVLDQENSKKFLQGSEEEKYAFFMKVTDLERIGANNVCTEDFICKMAKGHRAAADHKERQQSTCIRLQRERDEFEDLERLRAAMFPIKEQLVWAHVNIVERTVAEHDEKMREENAVVDALKEKIAELKGEIDTLVAAREEGEARCEAGRAEAERLKQAAIDECNALQEARALLHSLETARSSLEQEQDEKTAEKASLSEELRVSRGTAKRNAPDERLKALHDKRTKTNDLLAKAVEQRKQRGGEDDLIGLREALSKSGADSRRTKEELQASKNELRAHQAEVGRLRTEAFDPLSALGGHMPALVREINKHASSFESPPVGPLGASVQLKKEHQQFRICIEAHLSRNLGNFVVACQRDSNKLAGIMRRFKGSQRWPLPTIIVQPPQARHRPPQNPPGCLQIMQAIHVTNDQAFNALVDQSSIEKICVFPSKEEAEKVCLIGQSGRFKRMPHGMYEAYYLSPNRNCNKFNVSDGNLQTRTNVCNAKRHRRVLGVDEGTQTAEAQRRLGEAEAAMVRSKAADDAAARALHAATIALRQEETESDRLDDRVDKLTREELRISAELSTLQAGRNDTSDPTKDLEADLRTVEQGLEKVKRELTATLQQIREKEAAIEPIRRAQEDAQQAHQESIAASEAMQSEIANTDRRERRLEEKVDKAESRVAQAEEKLSELSREKEDAEELVKAAVKKANEAMESLTREQGRPWDGRRVNDPRGKSAEGLNAQLEKRKQSYEAEKARRDLGGKAKETVLAELADAKTAVAETNATMEALERNMKLLSIERNKRAEKLVKFRDYISKMTSTEYKCILQQKGTTGQLMFDMDKKRLGLTYQTLASDDASECRNVRQLSGGEKSYATLAMLLALGQCHEGPFRVMDEFDVFMDLGTRERAIQQILGFAKANQSKQFILITPQDLSSVTESDSCKIIHLKPPRRGDHNQSTLDDFGIQVT